jgi:hypothetical protein
MFIQEVVNTQTTQLEDELEQRNTLRILLRNFKENNSQNKKRQQKLIKSSERQKDDPCGCCTHTRLLED